MKEGKAIYVPMNGKYEVVAHNQDYEYDKQFLTIFPRMFSPDGSHIRVYKEWANIKGRPVTIKNPRTGEDMKEYVPTFGENLTFFFKYQVGWMYFRYFMWNFVGRQNDSQGHGEIQDGNWISGFDALDGVMIGDQKHLPDHMKNVPSRNKYYFLPLLLGLLGLFFHMKWNMKDFSVVLMLFIMTGLAIVVYLNQTPIQPRERDYAYAGSFYAFTIWIGLGVLNIALFMKKFLKNPAARASLATGICLLAVPALMAKENWDDHDRSGRYAAKAYAADYLNSCAKNAILFTYGDNDTFPLWYAQEVEGIRTDVRVVNTMLLNTDWYINQMKQKYYESDPLPITLADEKYLSERRSVTYVIERMKDTISIQQGFDFAASDEDKYKIIPQYGNQRIDHVPSRNYYMDVDPEAVLASGTVKADEASLIPKKMIWKITKNYLGKGDLIMMDIIAHNNWKRPIYFAAPTADATIGLQEYLQNEGIVYRLVPIRTRCSGYDCGRMKTDLIYENLMNKFEWGRLNEPDVYIDHFHQRTLMILRLRSNYAKLAQALLMEGKKDTAIKVLDRCIEMIPSKKVPHDLGSLDMISTYFMAGATDKGTRMLKELDNQSASELKYYFSLKPRLLKMSEYEIRKNLQMQNELMTMAKQFGQNDLSPKIEKQFNEYYDKFLKLTGNSR